VVVYHDEQSGPDRPDPIHDHHHATMQSRQLTLVKRIPAKTGKKFQQSNSSLGKGQTFSRLLRANAVLNASRQAQPRGGQGGAMAPIRKEGIASPAASSIATTTMAPNISATRDSCRIIHKELIGNVTGSVAFTIANTFALNPGLAASFPWLSQQAINWQFYRFNKLRFRALSRTGNTTPGSQALVPDYDASASAPASEVIASSFEDVVEDVPWKSLVCDLRPSSMFAMGPKKFVRTAALAANQDIKTYDAGQLFVTTIDGTAVAWSKLWVEYDITFSTPQLPPNGGNTLSSLHITSTTPTTASMLANPVIAAGSSSPAPATVALDVLTFPLPGRYLVTYSATATTSVTQTGAPTGAAGLTIVNTGLLVGGLPAGNTSGIMTQVLEVAVASPNGTLTFNNTIVLGLLAELFVAQVAPSQA